MLATPTQSVPERLEALVVGATGSVGRLVVEEAVRQGHTVRARVRNPGKALGFLPEVQVVKGDLTRPETLAAAVESVDAIVFTHTTTSGKGGFEEVDYGGCGTCSSLGSRRVRVALMTAIS